MSSGKIFAHSFQVSVRACHLRWFGGLGVGAWNWVQSCILPQPFGQTEWHLAGRAWHQPLAVLRTVFFFKGCEMVIPFNLFHVWNAVICYQLHIHLWERFYLWIPSCAYPIQAVEEIYKVMLQAQGPSCIAMEPSWGLYYVKKWWLLVFGCTCWVEVCARNGSKAENIQARLNDIQCSAFNTEVIAGMRVLCEEVLDRCLWCLGSITELQIWKQPKRGRALISTTQ